jgi:hypothetical protein
MISLGKMTKENQIGHVHITRIFKDPIVLSCGCLICHGHLLEKDVAESEQKCNECNQVFQVKDIQLNSNKGLKKLIED